MASEVERVALKFRNVSLVRVYGKDNPNWGYDWSELERTLSNAGAMISLGCNIFAVRARNLSEIWGDRIHVDDLSTLSDDCRLEISRRLTNLGRRFVLSDFEAVK